MFNENYSRIMRDIYMRERRLGREYYERNKELIEEYILKKPKPSYVELPRSSSLQVFSIGYNGFNNGIFFFFVKCLSGNSLYCYAEHISMDEIELYKKLNFEM